MALTINTNIASLQARRNLFNNTSNLNRSLEKLASGFRVNRAADDAAGLQISERLTTQVRGFKQALKNSGDGISLLQITEGTLVAVQESLQRIRELTVQAANDTNGPSERQAIANEVAALRDHINQVTAAAEFNGTRLFSTITSLRLQIGANATVNLNTIDIASALGTATFTALMSTGASGTITLSTNSQALAFLSQIDIAIDNVSTRRSRIGVFQNRIDSIQSNLQIAIENFSASNSRIRDVDVAIESSELTKNQILQQSALGILAQANQAPGLALSLIQ